LGWLFGDGNVSTKEMNRTIRSSRQVGNEGKSYDLEALASQQSEQVDCLSCLCGLDDEDDKRGISKYRKLFDNEGDMYNMKTGEDRVLEEWREDDGEELFSLFSVIAHTMPSAAATIARNA